MSAELLVGVVGNPNCGKTTLFNVLTGSKQLVGNWPGVTVEQKTGIYNCLGQQITLVDLPGTYSLESEDDSVSLDEKLARDFIASRQAQLILNIVDASHIERHLYLTSQLLEMRVPMIVVLNMMDAAQASGLEINLLELSKQLSCPVVGIVATSRKGLDRLASTISICIKSPSVPSTQILYHPALETAVSQLLDKIPETPTYDRRWLALRLLENDTLAKQMANASWISLAQQLRAELETQANEEIDILAADARYELVNQLVSRSVNKSQEVSKKLTERIDNWVLNRFLGIPIFLLVMYSLFMLTINLGTAFVDFFDQLAGAFLVDGLQHWLTQLNCWPWLVLLLSQGIGGGLQVVASFIPIVGLLFIALSILEDTGYMARAAFVMDRLMCFIGLPGKSFVPMIVGFGCNVPAIMATRTLENQRDRILTNLMNPFMSCGARLPVYALFAAAFFPNSGQNLVFGLYLAGILVAVLTGLLMRHTLLHGDPVPFIMELPTYHRPTLHAVYFKTWDRLKTFMLNAGKLIVPMVLVLNILNSVGTDGQFGQQNSQNSVLSAIGRSLTPMFAPMGINEDNWPATVGIFTGVLAKEAVVGTLSALYGQMAEQQSVDEGDFELSQALLDAWQTIPDNLALLTDKLLDPLGIEVAQNEAQNHTESLNAYPVMRAHFDGQQGAFAYLLFILLYTPCVAATAAIFREIGRNWGLFVMFWTTGIAYLSATLYYQISTFSHHPELSIAWIASLLTCLMLVIVGLRVIGKPSYLRHSA